jgi:UDP-4-amino-4,6-dideoxy-N-acetyl-beta-L-altrosamine transaminase
MIPYGRHDISDDDVDAVVTVLRSDFLTQGPAVPRFEQAVALHVNASHAVAMSSATAALHCACLALGLGNGDLLWTSPITFLASANCALYCGADIDFVDIDPTTGNLCAKALAGKLDLAARAGRLPKIVVPVHLAGQPCDMEAIAALARTYGFHVLEDASHAIGASYNGSPVGACEHSDITVFSFHPVKIITTAEGGMATTNDAALASRMALLRSHGMTRDTSQLSRTNEGPWYYEQVALGFNYRMTDVQAALGCSQIKRLTQYVARRAALAQRYDRLLAGLPVQPLHRIPGARSSWHLYIVLVASGLVAVDRRAVFEVMRDAGIGVNVHYIPVHSQPYYQRLGFRAGDFPQAEQYYAGALTLPLFPTMTDGQQDAVVAALREAVQA